MLLSALQIQAAPLAPASFFLGGAAFALLLYVTETWRDQPAIKTIRWGWLMATAGALIVLGLNPAVYRRLAQHRVDAPAFYADIAAEPEDYIVLDYPFGLAGTLDGQRVGDDAYLARYAVWHHKRTAGGVLPTITPGLSADVAATGFLLPPDSNAEIAGSATALADAVQRWRIGYVVVRPQLLHTDEAEQIEAVLDGSGMLCPPTEYGDILLYRARWHPLGCEESQ